MGSQLEGVACVACPKQKAAGGLLPSTGAAGPAALDRSKPRQESKLVTIAPVLAASSILAVFILLLLLSNSHDFLVLR